MEGGVDCKVEKWGGKNGINKKEEEEINRRFIKALIESIFGGPEKLKIFEKKSFHDQIFKNDNVPRPSSDLHISDPEPSIPH